MHIRSILNVLAALLTILGATMLLSAAWSFYYEEPDLEGLLMSSGITVAVSLPVPSHCVKTAEKGDAVC